MADSLADITLRYSRDLSTLQADCRRRADDIDRRLQAALQAVPAAAPMAREHMRARADAQALRDAAVAQADMVLRAAEDQARRRRSDGMLDGRQAEVDADRVEGDRKRAAVEQAGRAYQARLDEIDRTLPLDRQPAERRRVFEDYQQAVAAAEDNWATALSEDRDRQQANLLQLLERERRELDQASAQRAAVVRAADAALQRAWSTADERFAAALSAVPEAEALQARTLAERADAGRDCRDREAALHQAFLDALKRASAHPST